MVDWNNEADIGETSKGYFEIYDGATPYRFKLLQTVTVITAADFEKLYTDNFIKVLKSTGDSSTFEFTTKKTSDMFDTTSPATSIRTISYFKEKIVNDRVIPLGHFEGVQETESSSNKFIHEEFNAYVTNIEDSRDPTTGAPVITVSGEIRDIIRVQRTSS